MAAVHQACVCEIVLHFPCVIRGARVQQLLNMLPTLPADKRFVGALVRVAVPIEIATVETRPEDTVNRTAVESAPAEPDATGIHSLTSAFTE
jgi:hypothetical protein